MNLISEEILEINEPGLVEQAFSEKYAAQQQKGLLNNTGSSKSSRKKADKMKNANLIPIKASGVNSSGTVAVADVTNSSAVVTEDINKPANSGFYFGGQRIGGSGGPEEGGTLADDSEKKEKPLDTKSCIQRIQRARAKSMEEHRLNSENAVNDSTVMTAIVSSKTGDTADVGTVLMTSSADDMTKEIDVNTMLFGVSKKKRKRARSSEDLDDSKNLTTNSSSTFPIPSTHLSGRSDINMGASSSSWKNENASSFGTSKAKHGNTNSSVESKILYELSHIKQVRNNREEWSYKAEEEPCRGVAFIRAPPLTKKQERKKEKERLRKTLQNKQAVADAKKNSLESNGNCNGTNDSLEKNALVTPKADASPQEDHHLLDSPQSSDDGINDVGAAVPLAVSALDNLDADNLEDDSTMKKAADGLSDTDSDEDDNSDDDESSASEDENVEKNAGTKKVYKKNELVHNRPSDICYRLFAEKMAKYCIRMFPVDYVCTPHINNFEQMLAGKLPEIFRKEHKKEEKNSWYFYFFWKYICQFRSPLSHERHVLSRSVSFSMPYGKLMNFLSSAGYG